MTTIPGYMQTFITQVAWCHTVWQEVAYTQDWDPPSEWKPWSYGNLATKAWKRNISRGIFSRKFTVKLKHYIFTNHFQKCINECISIWMTVLTAVFSLAVISTIALFKCFEKVFQGSFQSGWSRFNWSVVSLCVCVKKKIYVKEKKKTFLTLSWKKDHQLITFESVANSPHAFIISQTHSNFF